MKKVLLAFFCAILVLGIMLGLASCGKVEFKVDFVVDGEIYASVNTSGKETIKIPNDPVKEGHVFDGWYWDKDVWNKPFTANSLLDAPLSENMSVYAKWTSSESVQGVEAEFDGFTKISDTEYSITVSNSTEAFSLGTKVTINSKSSWTLTSDIYGNTTISSKVAPLEIGDNVYYALVTAENGQSEMYKLNIRRRPMYVVTFNTNGGTVAESVTIEEGETISAPDTYKKGYTLLGWSYNFATPITQNETITALWLANEYVITYDANGGSVAHEETGVVYDVNYTLEVPTRMGYNFDGWYLGANLIENGVWQGDSDITVIAKWSLITYDIEYDLDGGTLATANPTTYNVESGKITLAAPTKTGYTFLGWTGTDVATPTLTLEVASGSIGNRSYVANWSANTYAVTFDTNGGNESYEDTTATYDATITLPTPTKTGYTFVGWFEGETPYASGAWRTDKNVDLVAKWSTDSYSIGYTLNGGSVNGTNPTTYNVESEFTLINPTKTGYTFLGWTYGSVIEPALNVTIANRTGNLNFVANFKVNEYALSFNSDGGASVADMKIEYGAEFTLPETTKIGYTFAGWYVGEAPFTAGNWTYTENKTVTAKWTAITYNINYTLSGGIVDGTNPTTYNVESEFTLINPTKTGYTFLGWTYGSVTEPARNVTISASTGDLAFVAHWKAESFKIYLDAKGGTVEKNEIAIDYDDEIVLPTPELAGHTFTGWFDGTKYITGGKYNLTTDMNLIAIWDLVLYDIEYDLNGGSVDGTNPITYNVEDEFTLINPTKAGYTFLGWTYEGVTEPTLNATISNRAGNLSFVANFKANTNTPYKVEYYFENSNKNGYDILNSETENLAGTTDTIASITPKTFEHFKFNSSKSTTSGNIDGEETLVFKVYYDRNSYTVTTSVENTKGGSVTSGATKVYGNEITVTATVKAGYTWLGWYEGTALVSGDLAYTFMPTRNISLVAKWSANEDTFYTVEYYHQNIDNNDYSLIHSDILMGTTDTLATATINSYPHFTYYAAISNASGNIDGDGEAVLKIYYTRSSYTVTTRAMNAKAGSVTSGSTYRYGKSITVTATTNPGYTFLGWYAGNTLVCETEAYKFTVENNVTLTAKWSANEDTKYTVEYYLENENKTGYTKVDTVILEGTTDTTANAVISDYEHFTFTSANSVISGNISGNGKLVLKVYYTRDVYTINSAVENKKAGTVTSGGNFAYENSVNLVASSNPGYTFLGWYEGNTKVCDTLTFTFNAEKSVTYTAQWSANTDTAYTVEYYLENVEKNGYDLLTSETEQLTGVTDTTATATLKQFNHFNIDNYKSTVSGNINGNGTLVLKVYYTRNSYNLASSNTLYGGITTTGTYVYGAEEKFTVSVSNVKIGCSFLGWYSENELLSTDLEYVYTSEKNVVAKFDISPEMQNFIFSPSLSSCNITGIKDKTVTEIVVPNYVTSISVGAFSGCSTLESLTIPFVGGSADATSWNATTLFGYIFGKTSYDGSTATKQYYDSSWAVTYYVPTSLKSVTITGSQLYRNAFENCKSITDVIMGNDVTGIGDYAFMGCSKLTNLIIGDGVLNIGNRAFYQCANLESATIGNSVKTIGDLAFSECRSLKTITLPDSVTTIEASVFKYCTNLENVIIGNGLTEISYATFSGCTKLTSISIGTGVREISLYAFSNCSSLKDVYIYDMAKWCSITFDFNGGNPLGEAENLYLNGELVVDLVIPEGITTISPCAFLSFDGIVSVTIPDSVTTIGARVFQNCRNLKTINYCGTKEQWNSISKGSYWSAQTSGLTFIYDYSKE